MNINMLLIGVILAFGVASAQTYAHCQEYAECTCSRYLRKDAEHGLWTLISDPDDQDPVMQQGPLDELTQAEKPNCTRCMHAVSLHTLSAEEAKKLEEIDK